MRKIGPNRAAPPIPDDIEHVATHTQVGNMNQYLLKSIKAMISDKVVALATVALATVALVSSAEDDVDIKGDICSMISG